MTVDRIKAANTIGTWNGNTYTNINGVTYTIITDKNNTIIGIKVNGVNTNNVDSLLLDISFSTEFDVILSGTPSGGGEQTYQLDVTGSSTYYNDIGAGVTIPSGLENKIIRIRIAKNYTANNIIFYPMIRLATDTDSTFQPYVKTNLQLTKELEGTKTTTGNPLTITDAAPVNAVNLSMDLEPIQDLHGYDHPWVGGAGKNLYVGSPSFDGYTKLNLWTKDSSTYNGHDIYYKTGTWNGMYKLIDLPIGTYTFSAMVKASTASNVFCFNVSSGETTATVSPQSTNTPVQANTWTKIGLTFEVTSAGTVAPRVETGTSGVTIYVSEYQLESGSQATSYASYTNICPISGRSEVEIDRVGKNILPMTVSNLKQGNTEGTWSGNTYTIYGISYKVNTDDGETVTSINCNGTSSNFASFNLVSSGGERHTLDYWGLESGVLYVLSGTTTEQAQHSDLMLNGEIANVKDTGNGVTISVTSKKYVPQIRINPNTTISNYVFYPMIRKSTDSASFVPYQGKTYTIQFGQTVYGCHVDAIKGGLVVDTAFKTINDLEYMAVAGTSFSTGDIGAKRFSSAQLSTIISSHCPTVPQSPTPTQFSISGLHWVDGFQLWNTGCTTFNELKQQYGELQVCYELATPFTIDLTPQQIKLLENTNTIYTDYDGDTIHIEYQPNNAIGEAVRAVEENYETRVSLLEDLNSPNAGFHNSIYRGKNLGTSVSTSQWLAIKNGTFEDLFIGDYWTINNITWRIAAFDYWMGVGENEYKITKHHIVIVPDQYLVNGGYPMNTSETTAGGYIATQMHTQTIPQVIDPIVENAFGASHIMQHSEMITDQVTDGKSSKYTWVNGIKSEIMNEIAVYGSRIFGSSGYDSGNARGQLPLFRLNPGLIILTSTDHRKLWWLRDVYDAGYFCYVNGNGYADKHKASNTYIPIRPYFSIYQNSES